MLMYFCCNFNIIVVWPEIRSKCCRTDFLPRTTPTLGPNRMFVSSAQFLDFQATRLCSFLIILMGRSEEFSFFCSACRAWKSIQSKQNELDFCSEVLNSEVKCLVWACPISQCVFHTWLTAGCDFLSTLVQLLSRTADLLHLLLAVRPLPEF